MKSVHCTKTVCIFWMLCGDLTSVLNSPCKNFGQPLVRVLNGNEVYRVFLRCRHAAKLRFIKLRSDVLVKLQLLDNKRGWVTGMSMQLCIANMNLCSDSQC